VPLGTGNDLARVLGLGEGYSGDVHTRELLDIMNSSTVIQLDRFTVLLSINLIGCPVNLK